MTRVYASPRRSLELKVSGSRVYRTATSGNTVVRYARSFRNRYTLRRFLTTQVAKATDSGMVSVSR